MRCWYVLLGVLALREERTGQGSSWAATTVRPSVGDTVWLERRFSLPAGWRLRAGAIERTDAVEPLGDPVVARLGADWVVRYAVTAWTPGRHALALPAVWRLGPDGQADSVAGGTGQFDLLSVIPDSVRAPRPQPALAPLRPGRRDPVPAILVALVAAAALAAGLWWRRRPPRPDSAPVPPDPVAEIDDARWLEAGEPKAVAARAGERLRAALARAVPEVHPGLSMADCIAALERHRPSLGTPVQELATVLGALDQAAFDSTEPSDITGLARKARTLADRLAGGKGGGGR